MRVSIALTLALFASLVTAEPPRALPEGETSTDARREELKNLNGYFPFKPVTSVDQWEKRHEEIRRRILVSQGLWPMPTKAPLNPTIHGRVEREDYTVDRVFFESIPGHFVTGSLYRPKNRPGRLPTILSPHGHWSNGRFYDAGEAKVKDEIASGAEKYELGGRFPIQARAVGLARMGCNVFVYDMTGNADSIQIKHRPDKWSHLDRNADWGFMSVQAELRLQNMMGLQTWNSIRVIDFLSAQDFVDSGRIGVTGGSGGGTQSMLIGAIDDRIAAAMPCVMVSTSMQGGCTCENAPLLRIDQGNVDIAAAIAPRPLGLTAADDWTIELETKGYPDLLRLYRMLGHADRLTAVFETRFKHNYNRVNRLAMYQFFNRHFQLGVDEPIDEADFMPLSREEATVWTADYPAPAGAQIGDEHEVAILRIADQDSRQNLNTLIPKTRDAIEPFHSVVGGAWETIIGRRFDEVPKVRFQPEATTSNGAVEKGILHVDELGEQISLVHYSTPDPKATVIYLTDAGMSDLEKDSELSKIVKNGYAVVCADLFGQGDFDATDAETETQPMWFQYKGEVGWQRFAGYTYGYNHSLYAKRVHDVLSLIKWARQKGDVQLVGVGAIAGPVALGAATQTRDELAHTFVDCKGFRFDNITRHNDPMFVPGSVKYFGIDGLVSLVLPNKLSLVGVDASEMVQSVSRASGISPRYVDARAELLLPLLD